MGNGGLALEGRTLFVVLAAVVVALLVCSLMAAPALAQAKAKAGGAQATAGDVNLQVVDCSQVQAALAGGQYNSGDAVSVSAGQYNAGNAVAAIAQELNISQSQVNACLGGGNSPENTTSETTASRGETTTPKGVVPGTESSSKLPNTGGAPLPGAIIGFAMVAAGILSAGAIVRRGR